METREDADRSEGYVAWLEVSADMTNVILMFQSLLPLLLLSWNTLDDFYNWILRFCSGNKPSVPVASIWQEISLLTFIRKALYEMKSS